MSRRHSDSKRRHSRFDPQPSPKRYMRDAYGKEEKERVANGANVQNGGHRRLNEDDPPSAKQRSASLHSKPNDQHAPHPTQHEKRGSTGQVGQSSRQRKAGERGWWKDARKQLNERAETSHRREQRDGKYQAKLDDNTFQRRDDFSERKDDPFPTSLPTSRKRPAFREKRIPMESGDTNLVAALAVNLSEIDHPAGRNERKKEERSNNPRHLGRPEKPFADDRAPNKVGARRDGFPSRGRRYGGNDSHRGRDKFNGRQDKIQTEKWKHDLYLEVSKDPIPQNEDDQIAKLEALLASS